MNRIIIKPQKSHFQLVGLEVKGVPYSNQQWIRFESTNPEGSLPDLDTVVHVGEGKNLLIGCNDQGVYRFVMKFDDKQYGNSFGVIHCHSGVVEDLTGIELVPVGISRLGDKFSIASAHMRVDILALVLARFGYRLEWGKFYYDYPHWHAVPIGEPSPEEKD